mgnify:FL=1
MKLEAEKFYLTEDGKIIKIVEKQEKDLFLDSDYYFYNEIGVNDIINTSRNLIAEIPKELHQYLIQTIKDYHTDLDFKATVDNVYGGK